MKHEWKAGDRFRRTVGNSIHPAGHEGTIRSVNCGYVFDYPLGYMHSMKCIEPVEPVPLKRGPTSDSNRMTVYDEPY